MDEIRIGFRICATVFLALLALPGIAHANSDLDRKYALETVGALRSSDNVDGLFADYVSAAYKDYFSRQSRFVLQDISKSDPILSTSQIPYQKLIQDPDILGQLARATRSQSLIRTKITKEGYSYRFVIEWLHSPEMTVMSREQFTLEEHGDGKGFGTDELKAKLEQALDKTIRDVPFIGAVTGRDGTAVTLNIGSASGVEVGDTLQIATLDQAKRHPLLNEVVDWQLTHTGKVRVDQVDDRLSFGTVTEEEPDHQIMRQQKITEIIHHPAPAPTSEPTQDEVEPEKPPSLGFIAGGVNLGSFNRSYTASDNTIGKSDSGFAYGFKVDGQLWVTKNWFVDMGFNFASWSDSQQDTLSGSSSSSTSVGSATLLGFKTAVGYSYLMNGDLLGPKGWVKLGYHSNAYDLPESGTDYLTPITFKSLFLGVGGDLPIRDGFGALMDFNIGLINSATENPSISGDVTGASDVGFSLGGYYRYTQRITFRATLDFTSNSADFSTDRTASQKVITFVPAVLYYF